MTILDLELTIAIFLRRRLNFWVLFVFSIYICMCVCPLLSPFSHGQCTNTILIMVIYIIRTSFWCYNNLNHPSLRLRMELEATVPIAPYMVTTDELYFNVVKFRGSFNLLRSCENCKISPNSISITILSKSK